MIRGDLAVKIYANISLFKLLLIFLTVLYLETTIFLLLGLNSAIACRENQLFRVAPFQHFNLLALLGSGVTFGLSLFFLLPIIKNQTVEITDEGVVVSIFGTPMTLDVQDLYQVLKSRNGVISYRFEKGDVLCQITPYAYHDAEILQEHFSRIFNLDKLKVEIVDNRTTE